MFSKSFFNPFRQMRVLFGGSMIGLCLMAGAQHAAAQSVTFAQFQQTTSGQQEFQYSNNGTSASFTTVANEAVNFSYASGMGGIASLPADLTGTQSATLTLSSTTTATAINFGGEDLESINVTSTLTITRDTVAAEGNGGRVILLQVSFLNGSLAGPDGTNGVTLSASSTGGGTAVFSSDFLNFSGTSSRTATLSFSSVNPVLGINADGFLNSFTASGTGTFSSNPIPVVVPEAASLWPVGALLGLVGGFEGLRRSRRRMRVA